MKPTARQTNNRVSMEAATDRAAHRKEVLARRKPVVAALRSTLRTASKADAMATLRHIRTLHGSTESMRVLINPTLKGMDVTPEKLTEGNK